MKKRVGLLGAFILGIVVASSAGTVAAKVQSLIGQKVTGELTVVVNGKELADKGAVINGKTNAPVRAITDAIGGTLKLEGKTINITTDSVSNDTTSKNESTVSTNKYIGKTKESLENNKKIVQENLLAPRIQGRDELIEEIKKLEGFGETPSLTKKKEVLAEYEKAIKEYEADLAQINEALQALEK